MGFLATHWRSVAFAAAALAVLLVGPASTGAAPTGLVGAYSFDAGSGSVLADLSGNGNNGAISGATWTSAGKNGGALSFDGTNDIVTVQDSTSLDLSSGMTLEAWVRPTANNAWRTIVTKEESGNQLYGLFSSTETGRPAGILSIGTKRTQDIVRGPSALALSAWTHVATTYEGSNARFYVNGSQVATMPLTGQVRQSNWPLRIGGNTIWAEWFRGQIDDLRIYNRALSASELQSDMSTPVGSAAPPADTQAPSAPMALSVSGQTQTSLTLSWSASTDDVGVASYGAYRDGASVGTTSAATRSYSFAGLTCGTTYSLAVDAADAAGNRSARSAANAATSPCTAPPLAGAIAAYSFDAGSGAVLADASGKGNNGTISGATWTSGGKSGGALTFDGFNDLVTIADSTSLDLTNAMTLEAWVRPTATGSWRTVLTKEMTGNLVYGLFSDSDTAQSAGIVSVGPLQDIVRSTSAPMLSAWTHLATTYDGANQRIYVNGVQVASRPLTGSMPNSTGALQIGGNNVWAEWFQGQIDDLRIYNRALTAGELQTDMNTPVAPPPPSPSADTQAPSAPPGLVVSGQTETSVNVSWNASTDNVGVAGYRAYRDGAVVGSTSAATRSYGFTGLACGTSYTFAVEAYDAAGNRSAKASLTASSAACPAPPPAVQCADGLDNDADGKIDLADPGCSGPSDTSESPDPTPPPSSGTVGPGQSWQVAYDAAPALGLVRVLAGTHPAVTLSGSKQVTFLGDEGAVVRSLDLSAPVTVENVDIDTGSTHGQFNGANPRVPGIKFKNMNISGDAPSIHVWSTDFVWDGGEFTNRAVRLCGLDSGVPFWLNTDRATIQNFTFHPWREDDPACMHGEDIRVQGGDDVTIRNVTFESPSDAGSGHILVTTTSASDPNKARRLRIEGSTFKPVIGTYAIQVSDNTVADGWVVKSNRWDQPPLIGAPILSNSVFCGNTGQVPASWTSPCP